MRQSKELLVCPVKAMLKLIGDKRFIRLNSKGTGEVARPPFATSLLHEIMQAHHGHNILLFPRLIFLQVRHHEVFPFLGACLEYRVRYPAGRRLP